MTLERRPRWIVSLLAVAGGVLSMCMEPGATKQAQAPAGAFYLWYMHQHAEHADNQLTVQEGVGVTAVVHYSVLGSPIRALGGFHLPLGFEDPDLRAIETSIRRFDLVGPEPRSVPPTFGMMKKVFLFREAGKEATHQINALEPTPEGLDQVEERVEGLMGRLAKGPVRALSVRLALEPAEIERGKPLAIEVTFTCLGRFPAEFPNPATFRSHPENSFRLNFWKPVKDEDGQPDYEFDWTLDLVGKELLTGEKSALRPGKALVRLEPGSSLSAKTTVKFPKSTPGSYRVELVYIAARPEGSEGNSNLIDGEIHADPVPLRVLR